ncbi:lipopolysaccharide biosynthesis protein [Lactovum odontotermitis]
MMKFVSRAAFLHYLGVELLGLNSLFTNLLGYLNFAELGIGFAITYSLYRPLAEKDEEQVSAIMTLYKKLYRGIALFVLVAGIILSFFVKDLIKGGAGNLSINIQLAFILAVINLSFSYFVTYKRTLITADQRDYLNQINLAGFNIAGQILQIILLVFTRNFYLYLLIQAIVTLLSNIRINHVSNKMYPYLKQKSKGKIKPETIGYLKKNVVGMISSKVGGIVVNSTDNLVLSIFVGLESVALYANYLVLLTGVTTLLTQVLSSATASIGNLKESGTTEAHKINTFYKYFSICSLFSIVCAVGFSTFSSSFIRIWLGKNMIYSSLPLFFISFNFLLQTLRVSIINYTNAYGLYWEERWKPVAESIINLLISVSLVYFFKLDVIGVLIGTISSNLFVNFLWEIYVVVKLGLKSNLKAAYLLYGSYIFSGVVGIIVGISLNAKFNAANGLVMGILLSLLAILISLILVYFVNTAFYPQFAERINLKTIILRKKR